MTLKNQLISPVNIRYEIYCENVEQFLDIFLLLLTFIKYNFKTIFLLIIEYSTVAQIL